MGLVLTRDRQRTRAGRPAAAQRWWAFVSVVSLLCAASLLLDAAQAHGLAEGDGVHAGHRSALRATQRSEAQYAVPDVALVRDDGRRVRLADELNDGRPVVLAFVYTSCTTVCPLISQTLAQLQQRLGTARDGVHLMSISIDPEQDTPARLHAYAQQFGAGPAWQHYTGTLQASVSAQRAFKVYSGSKMDHTPATLVRPAPTASWVRIEGFATADQLLAELPDLCVTR